MAPLTPARASGPELDPVEDDLLARINALRDGPTPLRSHPQLDAAAHHQAAWLAAMPSAERDGLSADEAHCGGPGCPNQRATAAGWPDAGTPMGEVVRFGGRSPGTSPQQANREALAAWGHSRLHAEQLHKPGWRHAGVAVVGDVAAVVFAEACRGAGCARGGGTGRSLDRGGSGRSLDRGGAAPGSSATPGAPARSRRPSADGQGPSRRGAEGDPVVAGVRPGGRCAPSSRLRLRRRSRVRVVVRVSCRRPGHAYRVEVRDGGRRRTVALRHRKAVVRVPFARRSRTVRVSVHEDRRALGVLRVTVRGR